MSDLLRPQPVPHHRIPHIDGLRGIAVLVILLFHLDITVLKSGFVGVDVFFVISGFLMTQIIAGELNEGRFSFLNFYARRIRRIFPALFVMLLGATILAICMLGPAQYEAFFKALRFASAQFSNILFSRDVDYFAIKNETSPLLHTWSLGVEEQFYFVWPFVLYLAHRCLGGRKVFIPLVIIFFISLVLSEYFLSTHPMKVFYWLPTRAWELAIGGIVALRTMPQITNPAASQVLSGAGLIMVLISVFTINQQSFPGFSAILPCLGTAILLHTGLGSTRSVVHRLLGFKPLVWVGLISYSLYLWHWPFIIFYKTLQLDPLNTTEQLFIGLASFAAATLSYYFIEKPTSRMKMKPITMIGLGAMVILIFMIGSNILKRSDMASWRVTYAIDKAETRPNEYFDICASPRGVLNLKDCVIGPDKDKYNVVLVGDSHASHYAPAVLDWAKSKGLTVRLMLRGACQAWVQTERPPMKDGAIDTDCIQIQKEFYEVLKTQKSVKYVFLSLKLPKDTQEIRGNLERINTHNKKLVFLGSAPLFEHHPHDCMAKNHLLITKILPIAREEVNCKSFDENYVESQLRPTRTEFVSRLQKMGIPYFDPTAFMKTAYDEAGHFLYMDTDHLNKYGGQYLARPLANFMKDMN